MRICGSILQQKNIETLEKFGHSVISVIKGELASGLYGEGRMAEPHDIVTYIEEKYFRVESLKGKKALVTAGPTLEAIDPVRFVGNHSSGKWELQLQSLCILMAQMSILFVALYIRQFDLRTSGSPG